MRPLLASGVVCALLAIWLVACASAQSTREASAPTTAASSAPFQYAGTVNGTADWGPCRFSAHGTSFVSADDDAAYVWDARSLRALTKPLRHPGLVRCGVSGDGKTAFTANDIDVRVWDVATSNVIWSAKVATNCLLSVDISPDGKALLTVDVGNTPIAMWHVGAAKPQFTLPGDAISAEFNAQGTAFVANILGLAYRVCAADSGEKLWPSVSSDDAYFAPCRARFSRDGRRLIAPQHLGFAMVDTASGQSLFNVQFEPGVAAGQVRFSPDGKWVAYTDALPISSGSAPARIYDAATGKQLRQFGSGINDCQITPDGRYALCRRWLAGPELWDLKDGRKVQEFSVTSAYPPLLSPDGSTIVLTPQRGPTQVWHMR